MSEMVERVAAALEERIKAAFSGKPATMKELAEISIKAMREPTDAMCEAAEWHQQSDVNAYQYAIDAALTEKT